MKITAVIIAKNEAASIAQCLDSLTFADEVVVIDNESTDKTADIAGKKGAKIFSVKGLDFAYLRNVGREKAGNDWLFYIDCDERPSEELIKSIKSVKGDGFSAYRIFRRNYYFNQLWPVREKIVRLIRKDALIGWQGSLHESPQIVGNTGKLKGDLLHYTHNNLYQMVEKTNAWSEFESQLRYKNNHPSVSWWRFFRVSGQVFWKSYFREKGYKAGTIGLIESLYQSFSVFVTYAKLWEKQQGRT